MLASQQLAEVRAAREDRERAETESANEVRFQLALYTWPHHFSTEDVQLALRVAYNKGSALVLNDDNTEHAVVTFHDGQYDVTVYSQEG